MSQSELQAPKGTRDLFGDEVALFTRLEDVSRRVFNLYRFSEVRTPLFESAELFSRTLGETSDVVEKEMFTFTDRGERTFSLRPEGTAGVVRHFIQENLAVKSGVHRLFYMGPMFRAERPQAGRYRQFWQIGSEHFGQADASADADTVLLAAKILSDFGLANFSVQVNTLGCLNCRPTYRKALLDYLRARVATLTEESQRRMEVNPLRVLDSKVDGPKLADAPKMKDFLCAECVSHHQQFLSLIRSSITNVEENPRLVRGLDYYNRSVFEFVSPDLGAQSALAAGGRYDGLVEQLGGPSVPGVGFALGMDRVVSALLHKDKDAAKASPQKTALVIPMMDDAVPQAFEIASQLRQNGVSVPPIQPKKKLKNQLSLAVDIGANWAILIGEDELKAGSVTVKDLSNRTQTLIPKSRLIDALK